MYSEHDRLSRNGKTLRKLLLERGYNSRGKPWAFESGWQGLQVFLLLTFLSFLSYAACVY